MQIQKQIKDTANIKSQPIINEKPVNIQVNPPQVQVTQTQTVTQAPKKENQSTGSKTTEELRKMLNSIQSYTNSQKNFIGSVFENLDIFMDQINQNQVINEMIVNSLVKVVPKNNPVSPLKEDINLIYEQINLLKKVSTIGFKFQ